MDFADNKNTTQNNQKAVNNMKVSRTSKTTRPTNQVRRGKPTHSQSDHVDKLERSKPAHMTPNEDGASRLISIDLAYDRLEEIREEYRQFFAEEQGFEEAWAHLKKDPDHAIHHLVEIFQSHNQVVDALDAFDKTFETKHSEYLHKLIFLYEQNFARISVALEPDGKLRFRKSRIRKAFKADPEAFEFLTLPQGFLKKLFDFYHGLKAIKPPAPRDDETLVRHHGLFFDKKI